MKALCLTALFAFGCAAAEPQVTFYLIEAGMRTASGRDLPGSLSLVKRTVDPDKGQIDEAVISARAGGAAQEFVTRLQLKGSKATISCVNCEMSGEGEFEGQPWHWDQFHFTANIPQAGRVEGHDKFTPEGMSAVKKMFGPDGKPTVVIEESGRIIKESTYEILRARLLAK